MIRILCIFNLFHYYIIIKIKIFILKKKIELLIKNFK
jgi:hypothetical protein